MIYYLAQKYTGQADKAFVEAIRDSGKLRKRGHTVFSPIMHNHMYDMFIYHEDNGLVDAPDHEDYLQWDLALCAGWLKDDYGDCLQDEVDECPNLDDCLKCHFVQKFDSGLVMLFAPSVFHDCHTIEFAEKYCNFRDNVADHGCYDCDQIWASKGAKIEYDWAHEHHVRCLLLEPFLDGTEVEI